MKRTRVPSLELRIPFTVPFDRDEKAKNVWDGKRISVTKSHKQLHLGISRDCTVFMQHSFSVKQSKNLIGFESVVLMIGELNLLLHIPFMRVFLVPYQIIHFRFQVPIQQSFQ